VPLWRDAAARLMVALAAALAPAEVGATTATDLCAAAADPCRVTTTVSVTPGSVIDLDTRRLIVTDRGTLDLQSGAMTLRADEITVESGGSIQARGNAQTPGGKIMAIANGISISGSVDASGAPGGTVTLTSMGPLTLNGPLDVRSRDGGSGGGSVDLSGTDVTVSAIAKITALGGGQDVGGDVQLSAAGALSVAGGIDASGGDGGTIDLSADTTLTIGTGIALKVDATSGGGTGGDITLSATGALSLSGDLSATGRNGSTDTGAGDGGTITVQGGSVSALPTSITLDVSAGTPDGIGGDIELSATAGDVDYRGIMDAQGSGLDGDGGTAAIDATGAVSIAGAIDAGGGRGGGGDIDLSAGTNLTLSSTALLSVAATSSGDGGDIELTAQGLLTVVGTMVSDGGPIQGANGGTTSVTGCTVQVETSGRLTALRTNGSNTLIGRDLAIIAGTLSADSGSGRNIFRYAGPDYEPAFLPGAKITPAAILIEDATVVPCNPVNTRTPTFTPKPTATRTKTRAATPTVTRTSRRTPTATPAACVGDCDGSGDVSVSDLVIGVNIALDNQPVSNCPAFDPDDSGTVTISELIQGVNHALTSCE